MWKTCRDVNIKNVTLYSDISSVLLLSIWLFPVLLLLIILLTIYWTNREAYPNQSVLFYVVKQWVFRNEPYLIQYVDPSREISSQTFNIKNVVAEGKIAERGEASILSLNSIFSYTHCSLLDWLDWTRCRSDYNWTRSG